LAISDWQIEADGNQQTEWLRVWIHLGAGTKLQQTAISNRQNGLSAIGKMGFQQLANGN
jgi:hypothetical protein